MDSQSVHVVTGAFGYSGRYITRRLLDRGCTVRTLTNALPPGVKGCCPCSAEAKPGTLPKRQSSPFGDAVRVDPFNFDQPDKLVESLRGVSTLYNTYWVRFNHRNFTFADAIRNSRILFEAARHAGVERIVHVSITNPSLDSPLEYFRGKAEVEELLRATGISHAILRPAVLFGATSEESILINNIAWMLRHLPVLGMFGNGNYCLQPIHVGDLANLAIEQGARRENVVINAIGPETFTYRELVRTLGQIIGHRRPIVPTPPSVGYLASLLLGKVVGDVIVTREEIAGLMSDLLCVDAPPAGSTKLTDWAKQNADQLGRHYASELARRR
jgi:nucleoside-diphosphate-sugar epimerase